MSSTARAAPPKTSVARVVDQDLVDFGLDRGDLFHAAREPEVGNRVDRHELRARRGCEVSRYLERASRLLRAVDADYHCLLRHLRPPRGLDSSERGHALMKAR